ncbi:MAG: DUF2971 domain-containing protein [Terriglobales bacterium]
MAIPADETKRYYDFVNQLIKDLGTIAIPPDSMLWHYTNGTALIAIIETGTIFATQLSGLNDTTELRYGSRILQEALASLRGKHKEDATSLGFIDGAIGFFKENTDFPAQNVVPHFVTCFSEVKDHLSQWRAYGGGENGYAIGFKAKDLWGCPNSMVARINYDCDLHRELARRAAEKALEFFLEGIRKFSPSDIIQWGREFLEAWNGAITMVAPLVKDPGFANEHECRIVKGFVQDDLTSLKFIQKSSLMSRHLPIQPGPRSATKTYQLPIAEVMVGPCRHREISRTSVDTLLRKKGYSSILVSISKVPFQVA